MLPGRSAWMLPRRVVPSVLEGNEPRKLVRFFNCYDVSTSVAIGPRQDHLAFTGAGSCAVHEISSGNLIVHCPTLPSLPPDVLRRALDEPTDLGRHEGHTARIHSVSFSPDGRRLVTGSHDGTTRLWDLSSGKEMATLIAANGGGNWTVVSPAGLFDGSRVGREKVHFRIGTGLDVVPLDRFFQDFYYPGLLAEIWRGEHPTPAKPLHANPALL